MRREAGQTAQCCHLSPQLRLAALVVLKSRQTLLWQTLTYRIITERTTSYLHTNTCTESLPPEQTALRCFYKLLPRCIILSTEL